MFILSKVIQNRGSKLSKITCFPYGYKMFTNHFLPFCSQASLNTSLHFKLLCSRFLFILQSIAIWLLPSLFYWKGSLSSSVSSLLPSWDIWSSFSVLSGTVCSLFVESLPLLGSLLSFLVVLILHHSSFLLSFLSWPIFLEENTNLMGCCVVF